MAGINHHFFGWSILALLTVLDWSFWFGNIFALLFWILKASFKHLNSGQETTFFWKCGMSNFSILPWRLGELQWFPSSLLVPPHVASQFLTLEKKHTRSIQCVCPNLGFLPIYHQFSAHVHGEKEVLNLPLDFVLDVLVCSYLLRQTQVPKWIHWWGEGEWNGEWSVASRRVKRDDVTRHDCWYLFSIQKMINDYSKIPKWAFYQFLICATVKRSKHGLLFRFSHEGWSSPP